MSEQFTPVPDEVPLPAATEDCFSDECRGRKRERLWRFKPARDAVLALAEDERELAKSRLRRFSRLTFSPQEMAAELEQLERILALMDTYPDSPERSRGTAYWTSEYARAVRHAERVNAAARHRMGKGPDPDEQFERRFAAVKHVDVVDLAQTLAGEVAVRRGETFVMRCPFHDEDTPSLTIYPPGQGWYCFGCGMGGDAVGFAAQYFQCSQVEALRWVEELCDVTTGNQDVSR